VSRRKEKAATLTCGPKSSLSGEGTNSDELTDARDRGVLKTNDERVLPCLRDPQGLSFDKAPAWQREENHGAFSRKEEGGRGSKTNMKVKPYRGNN